MRQESGFIREIEQEEIVKIPMQELKDFRLINESRSGLMRVFTARRSGRLFVVKTLREVFRNDLAANAALKKEYDLSIAIDSPFVAKVYDFKAIPSYGYSIIEEYCGPISLQEKIEANKVLTAEEVKGIIGGLFKAIDDIHAAGVIHRDIKPSNIIYTPMTKSIKVIDFGSADSVNYEILRGASGTIGYIPSGSTGNPDCDVYTDLYAAGVTISDLMPIAPRKFHRALRKTSHRLIKGELRSGEEAERYFERTRSQRKYVIWKAVIVGIGVALTTLSIFLLNSRLFNHAEDNGMEHADDIGGTEVVASPEAGDSVDKGKLSTVSEVAVGSEGSGRAGAKFPKAEGGEESIKNEYGVAHAEAKYASAFGLVPHDKRVVETTDKVLMELMQEYNEAVKDRDLSRRSGIVDNYGSFEYVSQRVLERLDEEGGGYDKKRALGLVKERMLLWQRTYRL